MKNNYFSTMPYGRILRDLVGSLILAMVITIFTAKLSSISFQHFLITFIWAFAVCYSQWLGHTYIFGILDKKYSWLEQPGRRAISGSFFIIVYAVFAYLVVSVIMARIVYGKLPENPLQWGLKTSYFAVLVSFVVSIVLLAFGFLQSWKSSLLETERIKSEMLMYKYESLQNQINPHFLFNSFNVLSDLVYEDQKKAVIFIKQMSELFRYVLDSRDRELVPIVEELEFISSFSFLLQTRFEDKLIIDIDIKAEPDEMMVPMTMQLLLENCVKHNEISSSKPLKISISREFETIRVVNNLQLKLAGDVSTGTGLRNIRQQYSFFTDRQIIIHESDETFIVEVPVLKVRDQ